jgi:hypothetical protein
VPLVVAVVEQVSEAIPAAAGGRGRRIQLEKDVTLVHIKVVLLFQCLIIILTALLLPTELLHPVIKSETTYQFDGDLFVLREEVHTDEEARSSHIGVLYSELVSEIKSY